jgi:hypothetical protein
MDRLGMLTVRSAYCILPDYQDSLVVPEESDTQLGITNLRAVLDSNSGKQIRMRGGKLVAQDGLRSKHHGILVPEWFCRNSVGLSISNA